MKTKFLTILCAFLCINSFSQIQYDSESSDTFAQVKNLSGPRVGVTFITTGQLSNDLKEELHVSSSFISQFGYQFEKQVMGDDKIAGLVEGIAFIGGLEYGLFLPSLSGMFGARFSSGYEFAIGPNISLSGASLVLGAGRTLDLGNLYIPINIAWVPSVSKEKTNAGQTETSKTGHRITLTIGFNFNKR